MAKKTIYISGVIGSEEGQYSLLDFLADTKDPHEQLDVIVDSVGGSVMTGEAIAERLASMTNTRTIAKKVYSIATKIFLSGKERIATPDAQFMIHNPFVMDFDGDKTQLRKVADLLEATEQDLESFYTEKTGIDTQALSALMESETFFDAVKAVALGFADKVESYNTDIIEQDGIELKAVAMLKEVNQSFNDYPQGATENARRAIKFKEERKELTCGTQVGWIRAEQLASGENLTVDTISRMAQFERFRQYAQDNYVGEDGQVNCGRVMWDAWGGDEGIDWAKNKLDELKNSKINLNNQAEMKTESTGIEKAFKNLAVALGLKAEVKNEVVDMEDEEDKEKEMAMEDEEKSYNMTDEELAKIAEMVTEMLKPQFESLQDETLAQAKNSAEEIQNLAKEIRSNYKPEITKQFNAKGQDSPQLSNEDQMWARMKERANRHKGVKTPQ